MYTLGIWDISSLDCVVTAAAILGVILWVKVSSLPTMPWLMLHSSSRPSMQGTHVFLPKNITHSKYLSILWVLLPNSRGSDSQWITKMFSFHVRIHAFLSIKPLSQPLCNLSMMSDWPLSHRVLFQFCNWITKRFIKLIKNNKKKKKKGRVMHEQAN